MKIELKDIKKDQIFWEYDCGMEGKMIALEDAHKDEKGWNCNAKALEINGETVTSEKIVEYFECFQPHGYGLKLYDQKSYA